MCEADEEKAHMFSCGRVRKLVLFRANSRLIVVGSRPLTTMFFWMVFRWVAVLCSIVSSVSSVLFEGDLCTTARGEKGVCSLFQSCASALQDFHRGLQPRRCGFQGSNVVVCCKDNFPTLSKSEEACLYYSNEVPLRLTSYILGGIQADIGEFPHMAALGYLSEGSSSLSWDCAGTLISDRYILTAAHCITIKGRRLTRVRLGGVDLTARGDVSETHAIDKVIIHPNYNKNYNDIALVRLSRPIRPTNNILPACLYTKDDVPQTDLIITGWGATDKLGLKKSNLLMKAKVKFMPLNRCNQTYARSGRALRNGVNTDMLCAYDPKGIKDTCRGDSGGPLQTMVDSGSKEVYSVVGVTSLGPALCGGREPAVYTKVASFVPWIESIVWS